ncbi:MAG: GlsB/YeaQ/YmgE family stress response membrane protein [Dietzia sp.]|uniref:GlsB/YeaQ/YmgE family stress response membrane protein n=1 Tax=Dietzia TaxID=37914 RepID=UPI0015C7C3C2|nr:MULTISPECIES: GlsB/YeaQ/YmgE family stress response membrane protein [Dietzia]MBB1033000.1 GlsB/YeaQ/YmgE family stress response membrane protein [Dietzia sp. CQ4]MBB1039143.1 GlsB/YeaQ/YmgE family stress response membrane protein [Dietzia natronolimnaea]MCT1515158.1 GlsB/YeaQ/YmgE family stress response membrane protein [Dietzia cercidiphylli]MDO8395583.1 GlsB/YeaQ/YmgE family stress response membrane protein [Dietzia sp.]
MMGTIIAWIIIGGLAGWIASKIMKRDAQMGIIANIAAGIVGAFIVGWLVSFFTNSEGGAMPQAFSIPGVLAAIVGACLVIWLVSLVGGRSNRGTRV